MTNFIQQVRRDLDGGEGDPGVMLALGVSLCKARQCVRAGLHDVENPRWEVRR